MARQRPSCFVIMPFGSPLYFFFLYLRDHIERTHGIVCRRADERFSTLPVRDKIEHFLRDCDIVLADCTGSNPNVFYELGIAHALGKDVILITQDSIRDAPSDVRHFEFIKYDLGSDQPFLSQLDAAIRELLAGRYDRLFEEASQLFTRYRDETSQPVTSIGKQEFIDFVRAAESGDDVPTLDDAAGFAEFALPAIVKDSGDAAVMAPIVAWLRRRAPTRP